MSSSRDNVNWDGIAKFLGVDVKRLKKMRLDACPVCKTECGYSVVGWPPEDEEIICRKQDD